MKYFSMQEHHMQILFLLYTNIPSLILFCQMQMYVVRVHTSKEEKVQTHVHVTG